MSTIEYIKPDKNAVKYSLLSRAPIFILLEGILGVAIYFASKITGIAVFLNSVIAIAMLTVVYFFIVRPVMICKTYKVSVDENYIEQSYKVLGEYNFLTPLYGKIEIRIKNNKRIYKNMCTVYIYNGEHKFVLKYLNIEDAKKLKGSIYERI